MKWHKMETLSYKLIMESENSPFYVNYCDCIQPTKSILKNSILVDTTCTKIKSITREQTAIE